MQYPSKVVKQCCAAGGLKIGRVVATWPAVISCSGLVFGLLCLLPLFFAEFASDPKLFSPRNGPAAQAQARMEGVFGKDARLTSVLYIAKNEADLADKAILRRIWQTEMNIQATRGNDGESWQDLCFPQALGIRTECIAISIFGIYQANLEDCGPYGEVKNCPHSSSGLPGIFMEEQFNRSMEQDPSKGGYGISLLGYAAAYLPKMLYLQHPGASSVLNPFEWGGEPWPAELRGLKALLSVYRFRANASESAIDAVEKAWGQKLRSLQDRDPSFQVDYVNDESIDHELKALMLAETPLLVVSLILMIIFVALCTIGRLQPRSMASRCILACSITCTTGLAGAIGMGLPSLFGVPLTMQSPLTLAMLLSVVVDQSIIQVHAFDKSDSTLSSNERAALGTSSCFGSITLDCLTSLMAFASCAIVVDLPAVQYFLITMAVGTIGVWIMQFTVFLGWLVLLERCCVLRHSDVVPTESVEEPRPVPPGRCAKICKGLSRYSILLAAMVIELVLLGVSCSALGNIKTNMNVVEYLPEQSSLRRVAEVIDEFWGGQFRPAYLVLPSSDELDYHDPLIRNQLRQHFDALVSAIPAIQSHGPFQSWLHDMHYYEEGVEAKQSCPRHQCGHLMPFACPRMFATVAPNTTAAFYKHLDEWRQQEPAVCEWSKKVRRSDGSIDVDLFPWVVPSIPRVYSSNALISMRYDQSTEAARLQGSRLLFTCRFSPQDSQGNIRTMDSLKRFVASQVIQSIAPGAYVWADWFAEAERDQDVLTSALHMSITILVVVSILLALLLHPVVGPIIGILLSLVGIQVLGLLTLFGISLDLITFIVFCMATGFAIEYVVHIAHAFMDLDMQSGKARMAAAMESIGVSVFSAFMSTTTQQLVLLCFANSYAFRKFCIVMELILCLSGMAGFLVVPGLLVFYVDASYSTSLRCVKRANTADV
eukprot:TRINITY_DN29873_c0_g1_i1.p1 TRINITY_DN29873_c0_g1~~TRINITY_DN29873_c0_g1_i1.p1  ORF type:complete len:937 (-),score=122.00 TRINITY_DN29873_c0_g1_i1:158-2968(-)